MTHDWRDIERDDPCRLAPSVRVRRCRNCRTLRVRSLPGDHDGLRRHRYYSGATGRFLGRSVGKCHMPTRAAAEGKAP